MTRTPLESLSSQPPISMMSPKEESLQLESLSPSRPLSRVSLVPSSLKGLFRYI